MADSNYPGGKLMMAIAGDDTPTKQIVMALVADLGFDPIDTGPLSVSRYLEPFGNAVDQPRLHAAARTEYRVRAAAKMV
jgi:predicted dinucleotide-binding enzyme